MKLLSLFFILILSATADAQKMSPVPGEIFNGDRLITNIDSNDQFIWVGTVDGLFRISKRLKKVKYYSLSTTGYKLNKVYDIHCQEDGCVWVATNNGLVKYDNYTFILYSTENSTLPEDIIVSVDANDKGELVVGTSHFGSMVLHRNRFRPYRPAEKTDSENGVAKDLFSQNDN